MDGEDIGAGIRTENWFGYAKLNKISNCQWGHIAGYKVVNAGILFSNYHDNRRAGVLLKSNAVVDFSGVHSSVFNNYEAKNTFEYNNTDNNDDPQDDPEVGGQLEFASDASTAKMVFETDETGLDFDPIDAKNNITRNSELDNYIYAPFSKTVLTIDSNYWENGIGNSNPPPSTSTALMPFKNITYPNGPASHTLLQEFSDITCGDPIATLTTWLADRQQAQSVDTNLPCKSLYGLGVNRFNQQRWQESYDAHKQYIEQCASDWDSYSAFTNMVVSNQMRSTDNNRYPQHLHWLKKVLYYSFDTLYYCENVVSMLNTFRFFDSTYGKYTEGAMTVARYMMDSAHCDYFDNEIIEDLKEGMEELYVKWRDTVQDSIATPFNPQFPSLEDLDLTILRGPQNSVTPATHEPRLGELIATRNPFTDILELKYRLSKSAMTRIDVYDLLGKAVYSEGQGYKPEGEHILSLQTKGWVAGSYYVRLSSPSGEVKTVKVVKE